MLAAIAALPRRAVLVLVMMLQTGERAKTATAHAAFVRPVFLSFHGHPSALLFGAR